MTLVKCLYNTMILKGKGKSHMDSIEDRALTKTKRRPMTLNLMMLLKAKIHVWDTRLLTWGQSAQQLFMVAAGYMKGTGNYRTE